MKISKLFHWLYASVMMLPLVVAPIFAIYSHRHNVTQDTIIVTQEPVYYETNEVSSNVDLTIGNIYYWNDSWQNVNSYSTIDFFDIDIDLFVSQFSQFSVYDLTEVRMLLSGNTTYNAYLFVRWVGNYEYFPISNKEFNFIIVNFLNDVNNIPNDFVACISSSSYQYVKEYQEVTTTYTNDVGTSFIDNVYVTLDKYFNVTSFLGLNDLYSWININVFSGAVPLGFNIFYMLLSYWLLISIFWLVFDVVMYVPNLAHRWLDKASLD